MPSQQAHIDDFRMGGATLRCFMSIYKGAEVLRGIIIGVPPFPITDLEYAVVTGDETDVRSGFRIDFFTIGGDFKGRTRIRFSGSITSTNMPIRELSRGSIAVIPGDTFRVYKDVPLSDKLPQATEGFEPDGMPASASSAPPPRTCSGGAWAGWMRQLPILMTGSTTELVDPTSSTPPEHQWNTDSLTISSGTDTDADIELEGDAGEYLVEHVGTDPDNSAEMPQYTPIIIHDADNPPYKVIIEDLPNDEARGGSARVRVLEPIPLSERPDGALAILWKEEFIAGTRQSFGARSPGRSHILFVGYIRSEEGEANGEDGTETLTFEIISPLARLDEIMGYSKVMIREASPDAWNEVGGLTVKRGITQIAMFYSTLIESGFDLVFTDTFTDEDYSGFFLNASTPIKQMRELADGLDCRVIEDRRGRFEVQMRPELTALSDRASLPVTLTLQKRDLKRWRYTRSHWRPVNRLEVRGFVAGSTTSANQPIFSEWVGAAPGVGNQTVIQEKIIVNAATPQETLNERAGRRGAALDGIYVDADGVQQMALDLELVLRQPFDLFDFYDELVEVEVVTRMGSIDFDDHQYVLVGSNISFDNGTSETTIRLRTCTNGAEGSIFVPKNETDIIAPDDPTPQPPPSTQPPSPGIGKNKPNLILFNDDSNAYLTSTGNRTAAQGGPDWTQQDIGLGSDNLLDAVQSPFMLSRYILVTDAATDAILTYDDPAGSATLTARKTLRAAITDPVTQWRIIDADFGAGYIRVVSYYGDDSGNEGVWVTHSTNLGVTWSTETQVTAHYSTSSGGAAQPGLFVSTVTPGQAYYGAYTASGSSDAAEAVIYTPSGSSGVGTQDILPRCIHRSFADGENTVWYGAANYLLAEAIRSLLYRKIGSGSAVDISPIIGGNKQTVVYNRSLHTCPVDANIVVAAVAGYTTSGVVVSRDKGETWVQISGGTTTDYRAAESVGRNEMYTWGDDGAIGYSSDLVTIDDRRGNIPTDYPSIGRNLRLFGLPTS